MPFYLLRHVPGEARSVRTAALGTRAMRGGLDGAGEVGSSLRGARQTRANAAQRALLARQPALPPDRAHEGRTRVAGRPVSGEYAL